MDATNDLPVSQVFSLQKLEATVQGDPDFLSMVDFFGTLLKNDEHYLPLMVGDTVSHHVDPFSVPQQSVLRAVFDQAASFINEKYSVDPFTPAHFLKEYGLGFINNSTLVNRFLLRGRLGEVPYSAMPCIAWTTMNWKAISEGATGREAYHSPENSFYVRLLTHNLPNAPTNEASDEIAKISVVLNGDISAAKEKKLNEQIVELKKKVAPVKSYGRGFRNPALSPAEKNSLNGTWIPACCLPLIHDKNVRFVFIEGVMKACSIAHACLELGMVPVAILGCQNWKSKDGVAEHFKFTSRQPTPETFPMYFTPSGETRLAKESFFIADANACDGNGNGNTSVFAAINGLAAHVKGTGGSMKLIRFYPAKVELKKGVSGIDDWYKTFDIADDAARTKHLEKCLKENEILAMIAEGEAAQSVAGCSTWLRSHLPTKYATTLKSHEDDQGQLSLYHFTYATGWTKVFPKDKNGYNWVTSQFAFDLYDEYKEFVKQFGVRDKTGEIKAPGATETILERALSATLQAVRPGRPMIPLMEIPLGKSKLIPGNNLLAVINGFIVVDVLNEIAKKYRIDQLLDAVDEARRRKEEWYLDTRTPYIFQPTQGYSVDMRVLPEHNVALPLIRDFFGRMDDEFPESSLKMLAALGRPLLEGMPFLSPNKKLMLIQGARDSGKTKMFQWITHALGRLNNKPIDYYYDFESEFQTDEALTARYFIIDEFDAVGSTPAKNAEFKRLTGGSSFQCKRKYKDKVDIDSNPRTVFLITNDEDATPFKSFEDITRRTCLISINTPPAVVIESLPAATPEESAQLFLECLMAGLLHGQGKISMSNSKEAQDKLSELARGATEGTVGGNRALKLISRLFKYAPVLPSDPGADKAKALSKGLTLQEIVRLIREYSLTHEDPGSDVRTRNTDITNAVRTLIEHKSGLKGEETYIPRRSVRIPGVESPQKIPTTYKIEWNCHI